MAFHPISSVLDSFDMARVTFARELRGFTQKELAGKIHKTPSAISQIESGRLRPDGATLAELALALQVPVSFFKAREWPESFIRLDVCHFRSRVKTSQRVRLQATRLGDLILGIADRLESLGVVFPVEDISTIDSNVVDFSDIDSIVVVLRRQWGLGLGPIPNLTSLFESKGIFVLPIAQEHMGLDAFSVWKSGRPIIFLSNNNKTAAHARFNLGHELGHLILHDGQDTGGRTTEKQADYFGGAFLLPRESFAKECPHRWDFDRFFKLSLRWKVSIQTLVVRAFQIGIFSKFSYESAFKQLAWMENNGRFGDEWPHEQSILIDKALRLIDGHVDYSKLVEDIDIHYDEFVKKISLVASKEVVEKFIAESKKEEEIQEPILLFNTKFKSA